MNIMTPGITKAGTGLDGITWNILGQTYVPKQLSENSFAWHATFPPGTFVPPHIHPTQDEFIYMLDGRFRSRPRRRRDFVAMTGDLGIASADEQSARHLQQNRPDGEVLFLGDADAQALRPVLGRFTAMKEHIAARSRRAVWPRGRSRRSCRHRNKRRRLRVFFDRGSKPSHAALLTCSRAKPALDA